MVIVNLLDISKVAIMLTVLRANYEYVIDFTADVKKVLVLSYCFKDIGDITMIMIFWYQKIL